jgi:hypothetical protein
MITAVTTISLVTTINSSRSVKNLNSPVSLGTLP